MKGSDEGRGLSDRAPRRPAVAVLLLLSGCHGSRTVESSDSDTDVATGDWWTDVEEGITVHILGRGYDQDIVFRSGGSSDVTCTAVPGKSLEVLGTKVTQVTGGVTIDGAEPYTEARMYSPSDITQPTPICDGKPCWGALFDDGSVDPEVYVIGLPPAGHETECWLDAYQDGDEFVTRYTCPYLTDYPTPEDPDYVAVTGTSRCVVTTQ